MVGDHQTPPHPPAQGLQQAIKKKWKAAEGWRFTSVGAVISIIITLVCLVLGVTGAISLALGVGGIAISLLLETLAKSYELRQTLEGATKIISVTGETTAARLAALEANASRSVNALEAYHDLSEVGDFRPDLTDLLATAASATKLSSGLIRDTAIELLHTASEQLSALRESRLRLDASYSAKLIDAMMTARDTVKGTSPRGIEGEWWTLQLYEVYLQVQKNLIDAHGVEITRIFIADNPAAVYKYMQLEEAAGIHTRFVYNHLLTPRRGLAQAYVLFDGTLLHRTIKGTDGEDENEFSENPADLAKFSRDFESLNTLSKAFADLAAPSE